jgi:hypothetical protein
MSHTLPMISLVLLSCVGEPPVSSGGSSSGGSMDSSVALKQAFVTKEAYPGGGLAGLEGLAESAPQKRAEGSGRHCSPAMA